MRILIIDDQQESVQPLIDELTKQHTPEFGLLKNYKQEIDTKNPDMVVLDLLDVAEETETPSGNATCKYIWDHTFCPIVIYTARADLADDELTRQSPFVRVVRKGADSELEVLRHVDSFKPHIEALGLVATEIRATVNGVLKEVAQRVFTNIPDGETETRRDVLVRSARRRVAAKMDEALSSGGLHLKSWEFYLCPPLAKDVLCGDIIRLREGNKNQPTSYAMVLTPSCDLVIRKSGKAKVENVLIALCDDIARMLRDLKLDGNKNLQDHREMILSTLNHGHTQSCIPLPALPGEFNAMVAELRRNLRLIPLNNIGSDGDEREWLRVASVDNPWRELVSWAYMLVAARPGLPDRDFSDWANEICAPKTRAAAVKQ